MKKLFKQEETGWITEYNNASTILWQTMCVKITRFFQFPKRNKVSLLQRIKETYWRLSRAKYIGTIRDVIEDILDGQRQVSLELSFQ